MNKTKEFIKFVVFKFEVIFGSAYIFASTLILRRTSKSLFDWKIRLRLFYSLNMLGHRAHESYEISKSKYFFERSEALKLKYLFSGASSSYASRTKTFFGPDMIWALGHMTYAISLRVKLSEMFPEIYPFTHEIIYGECQNETLLDLWSKYFKIQKVSKDSAFKQQTFLWPAVENYMAVWTPDGVMNRDRANDIYSRKFDNYSTKPIFNLSDEIKEFGLSYLRKFGFTSTDWFVTLHVRSSKWGPGYDSKYQYGRNADVNKYISAIKHIVDSGGWVVRIGEKNSPKLPKLRNVIDYTNEDFHDSKINTFFLACCKFMIGTNSGPVFVPGLFGKPVIMTNWPSLIRNIYISNSIVVPKLILNQKGKILTLEELFEKKLGYSEFLLDKRYNYKWLDNSSDDILQSVIEIESIRPTTLTPLQYKFDNTVRELGTDSIGTISNSFVTKYSQYLGLG